MPSLFGRKKDKGAQRTQPRPPSGVPENFGQARGGVTHLQRNDSNGEAPLPQLPGAGANHGGTMVMQSDIPYAPNGGPYAALSAATGMDRYGPNGGPRPPMDYQQQQQQQQQQRNGPNNLQSTSLPDARQNPYQQQQQQRSGPGNSFEHQGNGSMPGAPDGYQQHLERPTSSQQTRPGRSPSHSSNGSGSGSGSSFWSRRPLRGQPVFPRRGFSAALHDQMLHWFGGKSDGILRNDLNTMSTVTWNVDRVDVKGYVPAPREGHAAAFIGRTMFVFGGEIEDGSYDNNLYAYNMGNCTWYKVPMQGEILAGRKGHTTVSVGSKLFVFGGTIDGYFLNDLVSFDVRAAKDNGPRWSFESLGDGKGNGQKPASASSSSSRKGEHLLPPARAGHSCSVYPGSVYVFGGMNGERCFNDLWIYDFELKRWHMVVPNGATPPARYGHASAVVDDCIFIMGGRTLRGEPLNDFFAYKISSQRWYTFQVNSAAWPHQVDPMFSLVKTRLLLYSGNVPHEEAADPMVYSLDTSKIKIQPDNSRPGNVPSPMPPPVNGSVVHQQQQQQQTQGAASNGSPVVDDDHLSDKGRRHRSLMPPPAGQQQSLGFGQQPPPASHNMARATSMVGGPATEQSIRDQHQQHGQFSDETYSLPINKPPFTNSSGTGDQDRPSSAPTQGTTGRQPQQQPQDDTNATNRLQVTNVDTAKALTASMTMSTESFEVVSPLKPEEQNEAQRLSSNNNSSWVAAQNGQGTKGSMGKTIQRKSIMLNQNLVNNSATAGSPSLGSTAGPPPNTFPPPPPPQQQQPQPQQQQPQPQSQLQPQPQPQPQTNADAAAVQTADGSSPSSDSLNGGGSLANGDAGGKPDDKRLTIQLRNRNSVALNGQVSSATGSNGSINVSVEQMPLHQNSGPSASASEAVAVSSTLTPQQQQLLQQSVPLSMPPLAHSPMGSAFNSQDTDYLSGGSAVAPTSGQLQGVLDGDKADEEEEEEEGQHRSRQLSDLPEPELPTFGQPRNSGQMSISSEAKDELARAWATLESKYSQQRTVSADEPGSVSMQSVRDIHQDEGMDTLLSGEATRVLGILLSMRRELADTKQQLSTVSRVAIERVSEAERGRKAALQEAIYLKAKASALITGNSQLLSKLNGNRIHELERLYANTLNDNDALRNQLAGANLSLKQSHDALAEFKTDAELTRKQLRELEQLHGDEKKAHAEEVKELRMLAENAGNTDSGRPLGEHIAELEQRVEEAEEQLAEKDKVIESLTDATRGKRVEEAMHSAQMATERAERVQQMYEESLGRVDELSSRVGDLSAGLEKQKQQTRQMEERASKFEQLWTGAKQEIASFGNLRRAVEQLETKERQIANLERKLSDATVTRARKDSAAAAVTSPASQRNQLVPFPPVGARSSFSSGSVPAGSAGDQHRAKEFHSAYLQAHRQWSETRDELLSLKTVLRESDDSRRDTESRLANRERELGELQARLAAFTSLLKEYDERKVASSGGGALPLKGENDVPVRRMLAAIQQMQRASSLVVGKGRPSIEATGHLEHPPHILAPMMEKRRLVQAASLVALTGLCWMYGFHLYRAANRPLVDTQQSHPPSTASHQAAADGAGKPGSGSGALDDSSDGILTFMHASDVHISKFVAAGGLVHFQHLLHTAVPLISPRLVVVTGDLTDGKDKRRLTSMQQPDEWEAYRRALDAAKVTARFNGTFYRDQRGNHDCFNVFGFGSDANMYRTHSAVQSDGYSLHIREPFGTYSFVASDSCPRHGFARPLNFFGYLDAHGMRLLESRIDEAKASNHLFLLNHYPVSTMLYGRYSRSFRELAQSVSVFLCGHLHELVGGIGTQLQAYRARDGYWELEIGDLKEHAVYRVYAVDHDLVSFVDVTLPLPQIPMDNPELLDVAVTAPLAHPPVVLVTNPKDARYLLPKHEPLHLMRSSRFIRALIWADTPIESVVVTIDGAEHPHPAEYRGKRERPRDPEAAAEASGSDDVVATPLWVVPWDPAAYDDGKPHVVEVMATDAAGKTTTARTPFHFTADLVPLDNASRGGWIMRQSFPNIFRTSGTISYLLAAVFLVLFPRLYLALRLPRNNISSWISRRSVEHHKDEARLRHLRSTLLRCDVAGPLALLKLVLGLVAAWTKFVVSTQFTAQVYFASIGWLFWPSYFFTMALATLPIFTGRLIPSAGAAQGVGSVYAYGIYIAGDWAPLLDSWTYALASIVSLALLLLYLPAAAAPIGLFYSSYSASRLPWYRRLWMRVAVGLFVAVYMAIPVVMTVHTYGIATVFFGYGRAWPLAAAAIALYLLDWRYPVLDNKCPASSASPGSSNASSFSPLSSPHLSNESDSETAPH
ncbi:hypothetical protein IWW48_002837 [Coemansia sp. RSA 1200]|nr:hypothetical protein IWW48_002837 [Coemansia sp. RSA 1200]